jgi:nucleoside-diphosphate-sugar epimerase
MRVLVIGASGYLGGAVAKRLVLAGHEVTGLVRNAEGAATVSAAGIAPRLGTLEDSAILTSLCADADAVVNAADSDHKAAVETILAALAGTAKTFIHTSGISVTADRAIGAFAGPIIDEHTSFTPLPERAARFALDQSIRRAGGANLRTIVICCPLVYGAPAWEGRESVQLPHLIADARRHGRARHIGAGASLWSNCHIDDVATAYVAALTRGVSGALYYPESGEASWRDIASMIGARLGLHVASITLEEAVFDWGPRALWTYASNARTRSVRLRADLGWRPAIDGLSAEIERLTAQRAT